MGIMALGRNDVVQMDDVAQMDVEDRMDDVVQMDVEDRMDGEVQIDDEEAPLKDVLAHEGKGMEA